MSHIDPVGGLRSGVVCGLVFERSVVAAVSAGEARLWPEVGVVLDQLGTFEDGDLNRFDFVQGSSEVAIGSL